VFRRLFRDVGLPEAIRTDNGAPFASTGIHGLCELNVWWMQLGIVHQRIPPASPQENGTHERMHRVELPRFRGHLIPFEGRGVHDAQIPPPVPARV
jgi:transposase InsO family protein